ncbi:MAG: hypothetical protein ACR2H2_17250 [Solirubrobacteraceae bacterium]
MRFVDFLRAAVLLCGGAATALATVTVLGASADANDTLVFVIAGWWIVAGMIGTWLGRRAETNSPIARLLATAKSTTSLPEQRPGSLLLNRMWPLLLSTILALGLALVAPQIPGIACGFAIIGALAWRRQEAAVAAIEDRDGVAFYVEPTPPHKPIKLIRAPGFRRDLASANGTPR